MDYNNFDKHFNKKNVIMEISAILQPRSVYIHRTYKS